MAESLTFVQAPSGTVHVCGDLRRSDVDPLGAVSEGQGLPLALLVLNAGVVRTLCGLRLRVADCGGPKGCGYTSRFPDEALCGRCHRALGADADRAFEHDVPEETR